MTHAFPASRPAMSDDSSSSPSLWQVTQSVLAAMIGVQSGKNHERDFQRGKASQYVIIGIVFTALFVLTVAGVVKLVLHLAGV
jgi:hypothetical protein